MDELLKLPNIGKILAQNLLAVGIDTPEKLRQIGSKQAFLLIKTQQDSDACLHMLYGIQSAIEGIADKFLAEETKLDLKNFFIALP
ncbi:TfoX/Sxy family DNA transformation protein [Neisseria sp. Ec49-e6-T10]|uniref:TfoX/Sxy family DNA transformation protein n=1 Tax=Neisseria sp. Ec49-e6-T10 TaxID=3140744 RepID=UPI003EBB24EC